MAWQRLGEMAPTQLVLARLQAHWAAQAIAAAGETYVPATPDTGHTAMTWDAASGALVGRKIRGPAPCRVALRVDDLTLRLLSASAESVTLLALPGRTLREAYAWISDALKAFTRGALARDLVHPAFELEPHALAQGGRFERDAGLPELSRWYANGALVLERFARATSGAGELLCWPHHFDLATLVAVETDAAGEAARTVGVGLSPGDAFVAEPYVYVSHGPTTEQSELPALAEGEWFRDGFIGAVLRSGALVAAGDAATQERRFQRFVDSAYAVSRTLALEAPLGDRRA